MDPGDAASQQNKEAPMTGQPRHPSAQSPLPADTADTPNQDPFVPAEDDITGRKQKRLQEFTTEELLDVLVRREKIYKCDCGAIFQDLTVYMLHKGCHHEDDPLMCAFCCKKSKDWYDFQTHFFQHKRKSDD